MRGLQRLVGMLRERRAFSSLHLVFRRAEITSDPVLVDNIHHELISQLLSSNKKLNGLIRKTVFLLDAVVIRLNEDRVLLTLRIRPPQLNLYIRDALETIGFAHIELDVVAFAFPAQSGKFTDIACYFPANITD